MCVCVCVCVCVFNTRRTFSLQLKAPFNITLLTDSYFSHVLYCDYVLLNGMKKEKVCSDRYLKFARCYNE